MPLGTIWSPEEDLRLGELVKLHGPKKWSQIAADLNTNKGSKQCRRRWKNFLSLDERKLGSWTQEEDEQLLECHRKHGNKWTLIAQEIGGRTDNAVKNRWAALEKKRRPGDDGYGSSQGRSSYSGRGDLLAVRRVIAKDQPQRSYGARQQQQQQHHHHHHHQQQHQQQCAGILDAAWMQDSLGQSAAAAAAAAQQQHQQQHEQQQAAYTMQPAAFGGQPGSVGSSLPMAKPDLKINIPGATAPELPYSQRSQTGAAADQSRLQKAGGFTPREVWLDQVGKGEDDALLSTSRQGAQAAMAGLQTPTEEGGTIAELYRFLYSGTPAAQTMAAAAAGQPGPVAPWRQDSMPQGMPQQQLQQLPASSSAACMGQQQHQQMYPSAGYSWAPQDAAAGAAFLQMQQQQQQQSAGRMVPPPGMHYSQPQLQQPMHVLSKLSRTVSGFDSAPHAAASMLQPSLPDAMMLRQSLPPPQPRFVPQAPPQGTAGMGGMGPAGGVMGHNNAAVITAAGGFQPAPRPGGQMQGPDQQQQQHMMYRQHMPVLSQQQQPAPHLMPQEPLAPQHIQQQQQQQQMMRAMHADMQAPPAHHQQGFAAPPPSHPPTSWNAEDLRQLLDILHADGGGAEGQVPVLGPPPALYHIPHHPAVDECKLEHANNVTGSLTAAT